MSQVEEQPRATHQCVPLSTGALGPDLRVNYQFGLVLGADEFNQTDRYFLERNDRDARTFHGYGTGSGLDVTVGRSATSPDDVEVRVDRGIGVDQHGGPIVLRSAQCGLVGAWIAEQERNAQKDSKAAPLGEHIGPSGDVTVYVVASYATCLDALVPLPGNPCGEEETTAPSRIRDSWNLEFRWEPPAMPAWDGVRALADLLVNIELDDTSPFVSDEAILSEHVRALAPGAPPAPTSLPQPTLLPRQGARAALDRLVTLWITDVRPKLLPPDLIAPEGEAGILLSAVTVVPAHDFHADHPVIDHYSEPDDEGRPYLAPTQLIQELAIIGGEAGAILAGSPIAQARPRPQIEVASLAADGSQRRNVVLWSHLDRPLIFRGPVPVRRGGRTEHFTAAQDPNDPFSWHLAPGPVGQPLQDFEHLTVELHLDDIEVGDSALARNIKLSRYLEQSGLDAIGRIGDVVEVHHQVEPAMPVIPPSPEVPPPRDVREVLTATATSNSDQLLVELWFHVDKHPMVDDERVAAFDHRVDPPDGDPDDVEPQRDVPIQVLAERDGPRGGQVRTPIDLYMSVRPTRRHNVFMAGTTTPDWKRLSDMSPYLRVVVRADLLKLEQFGGSIRDYLKEQNVTAPNSFDDGNVIVVYVRVSDAGQR